MLIFRGVVSLKLPSFFAYPFLRDSLTPHNMVPGPPLLWAWWNPCIEGSFFHSVKDKQILKDTTWPHPWKSPGVFFAHHYSSFQGIRFIAGYTLCRTKKESIFFQQSMDSDHAPEVIVLGIPTALWQRTGPVNLRLCHGAQKGVPKRWIFESRLEILLAAGRVIKSQDVCETMVEIERRQSKDVFLVDNWWIFLFEVQEAHETFTTYPWIKVLIVFQTCYELKFEAFSEGMEKNPSQLIWRRILIDGRACQMFKQHFVAFNQSRIVRKLVDLHPRTLN